MAAKKAAVKSKTTAKAAPPASGDANDHYNHGLRLMMSIEAELRGGTAVSGSPGVVAEAEASLKKALELASNHGRAHIMLGNLYRFTDRAAKGVPHFEEGLGLPPESDDWVKACDGLASCHMTLGADAAAVKALKLGIKNHPSNDLFHFKLGAVHVDAGRIPEAKKSLEKVLELHPGHSLAVQLLESIGGTAKQAAGWTGPAGGGSGEPPDYVAAGKKAEKLAADLQAEMAKIMSGTGSPEAKTKKAQKLQEDFQKAVQKLYGG
ncbi:MAG: hypothetical protein K8T20_12955 [Planctomycetes bacterium]|nr:hypothetical protein [Planctomycetota bacterium]